MRTGGFSCVEKHFTPAGFHTSRSSTCGGYKDPEARNAGGRSWIMSKIESELLMRVSCRWEPARPVEIFPRGPGGGNEWQYVIVLRR